MGTARNPATLPADQARPGQLDELLRGVGGDFLGGIPRAEKHARETRPAPIGVSVDDDIARLIRRFPRLKSVFPACGRRRARRIRDLELAREERDRLLYHILAIEKAGKLRGCGRG